MFVGMAMLALAACSNKPLCPAYTDAEPVLVEMAEENS